MPIERQTWAQFPALGAANARLARHIEVFDRAARVDVQALAASATLAPTYPHTLYLVTTSGGSVTLTLPPARTVPGFRLDAKKLTAANTMTLDGAGSETIDGAATLAVTTQWESVTLVSDGTAWYLV